MKEKLPLLISFLIIHIAAFAQIPQSGIYQSTGPKALPVAASPYTDVSSVTYNALHLPGFTEAFIKHAIVATDSINRQLKVLFIIDSAVAISGQESLGFATISQPVFKQFYYTLGGKFNSFKDSTLSAYGDDNNFNYHYWRDGCYFMLRPQTFRIGSCEVPSQAGDYAGQQRTRIETFHHDSVLTPLGKMPESSRHLQINQPNENFQLYHAGPFKDILRNNSDRIISVYTKKDTTSTLSGYLKPGAYMVVKTEDDDWYQVSIFSQHAVHENPSVRIFTGGLPRLQASLKEVKGYVLKDALHPSLWILQQSSTDKFRFYVDAQPGLSDQETHYSPATIKVVERKTGRRHQLINNPGEVTWELKQIDNAIQLVDANFDGYPDIRIRAYTGGAGPNTADNIYLFNPVSQKFEINTEISELSQLEIDSRNKLIRTYWRAGAGVHGKAAYQVIRGKLKKVYYYEESYSAGDDDIINVTEEKLVNGKWIRKRKQIPAN